MANINHSIAYVIFSASQSPFDLSAPLFFSGRQMRNCIFICAGVIPRGEPKQKKMLQQSRRRVTANCWNALRQQIEVLGVMSRLTRWNYFSEVAQFLTESTCIEIESYIKKGSLPLTRSLWFINKKKPALSIAERDIEIVTFLRAEHKNRFNFAFQTNQMSHGKSKRRGGESQMKLLNWFICFNFRDERRRISSRCPSPGVVVFISLTSRCRCATKYV